MNIHPFVGPEKGVQKVRLYTSTKTARQCVDVFHRNYSSAGGTDQRILPATLTVDKPDLVHNCVTLCCWTSGLLLP